MCELRLKLGGGHARCHCRSLTHISFLVETDDRAVQPLARVPGGQRIRVTACLSACPETPQLLSLMIN